MYQAQINPPVRSVASGKKVFKQMPVKLTRHLFDLCQKNPALQAQFLPDIRELAREGEPKTWVGLINTGIKGLERMYGNRCIILLNNDCPAYCRFCFRKFYDKAAPHSLSHQEIDLIADYISNDGRLKSVLITGGDPLLAPEQLEYTLKKLRKIPHIGPLRIGTRSLLFQPEIITARLIGCLRKYHDPAHGKPIEIATHFNHSAELSPQTITAVGRLTGASFRLYNQTVLLKGVNDDPEVLLQLFEQLNNFCIETYYLFHCEPVKGIGHLRTSIAKGLEIKKYLRENGSGRANPAYLISTRIGKVEIGVDGEIVGRTGQYLWIKTPYHLDTYQKIDPAFQLPPGLCKIDSNGYIIIKYLDGGQRSIIQKP